MEIQEKESYIRPTHVFWWLLRTFLIPLTIPYCILNIWNNYQEKKYRNCLPSKVVFITGASSGLGEALAHVFYKAGCKVVLAARRESELNRVRSELLEQHTTVPTHPPVILPLDLSDLNSLPLAVSKILSIFGHIDILINNGGISVRSDAVSTSIDVDVRVMLVNYFGAVALTKAILPSMIQRKEGRIVFVNSVQGKFAIPFRSAYSASKHALQAFADSLRPEIAKFNVKVTNISPGYIRTSLSVNALTGNGNKYGINDNTTASGANPESVALSILKAILRNEKDVIMAQAPARIAYWTRFFCPSIYFWIMERRAQKLIDSKSNLK